MSEEILGIFRGYRILGRGFLAKKWECKLYFTTNRLIVEKETGLMSRLSGPFKGALDYYLFSHVSPRDKLKMKKLYDEEKFNHILKANKENFQIPYSDITVVEFTGKDLKVFIEDLDVPKYKFHVFIRDRYEGDFMNLLSTILPDRV